MPELAVDPRTVGGAFSVDECARRIIHYRYAENVCMTTEGAWASSHVFTMRRVSTDMGTSGFFMASPCREIRL